VEAAEVFDKIDAGAEVEVVGVAEENVGAEAADIVGGEGLDGALSSHGHEGRGGNLTVESGEEANAVRAGDRV
jgi:hypothetical protein